MSESYSPFTVPLADLDAEQIARLVDVKEGWYIDYKRALIGTKEIAKALSAFANTYGGWLIFGVMERDKTDPVAGTFSGIARSDVEILLQRIRQAAHEHVSPAPHFEIKCVWGPSDKLQLAENSAVVCVRVPLSFESPHVHSDGRVYRRVADSSEPKHETDRFILDDLWKRRKPIEKAIRNWIKRKPEFSKQESRSPIVRLLLTVDPWGERTPWLESSLKEVRALVNNSPANLVSIPFDAIHTNSRGFLARQLFGNNPNNLTLTWKFSRSLSGEVLLPLNFVSDCDTDEVSTHLDGYEHADRFEALLTNAGADKVSFADLNMLFTVLQGICTTYRRMLRAAGAKPSFYFKAQVLNAWRVVPFIDTKFMMDAFEEHGIVMSLERDFVVPLGNDPNSFFYVPNAAEDEGEAVAAGLQSSLIFAHIAEAWGLPAITSRSSDDPLYDYEEIFDAQRRAQAKQDKRNSGKR